MREDSGNKIDFNKIKFAQIRLLLDAVKTNEAKNIEYIKGKYQRYGSNFNETLDLLRTIAIAKTKGDQVYLHSAVRDCSESDLKKRVAVGLLGNRNKRLIEAREYIENFRPPLYIYTPQGKEKTRTSGVRNLLIDLGVVSYSNNNSYLLLEGGRNHLVGTSRKTSANALTKILKAEAEIGLAAERVVIEYEKSLSKKQKTPCDLEHTSQIDVGAGYDIKVVYKNNPSKNKYIEVKAISSVEPRFYWSRNEVEVARTMGKNYYLYLLPVAGPQKFDIDKLTVVNNPYKRIFKSKTDWIKEIELYSFSGKRG